MSDKIFIDTNIFVYAKLATEQEIEKQQAKQFLKAQKNTVVISTQVLSEFTSVLIKHRIDDETIKKAIAEITQDCFIAPVSFNTIQTAWEIKTRYQFSCSV